MEIHIEPQGVAILSYTAPDYSISINTKYNCSNKSKLKSKHKDELKGELKTLRIILDLMIENPEITTMALVEKSGKSRSTVQKSIRILRNEYCIDRVGGKKYGRWIVLM